MAARKKVAALFANPAGKLPDWDFGWLRHKMKGETNSVAALALQKLTLGIPDAQASWQRRCWKAELLLPPAAPDILDDAKTLFERIDITLPLHGRRDLALILTWWTPEARALHTEWERVRSFVRQKLVNERHLPALLVQHAPHAAGQATPPHLHAVVSARQLSFDLGAFTDLEGDAAQTILWDEWRAFIAPG